MGVADEMGAMGAAAKAAAETDGVVTAGTVSRVALVPVGVAAKADRASPAAPLRALGLADLRALVPVSPVVLLRVGSGLVRVWDRAAVRGRVRWGRAGHRRARGRGRADQADRV